MNTIGEWRRNLTAQLKPAATKLAAFEAHCLIGHVLGYSLTELTLHSSDYIDDLTAVELEQLLARRLTGEPLAYVLGHAAFRDLDLICDSRALIPRPETEELVELALECLDRMATAREKVVVDVGTGSGNIALALASERSDIRVIATDVDSGALSLANDNRRRNGLVARVQLIQGDSLSMFRSEPCLDVIVTNPPYIAPGDPHVERSVHEHEPHVALYAEDEGFAIILRLLQQAEICLRPGGWLISEIGDVQAPRMRSLYETHPAWCNFKIHRDLAGVERMLTLRRCP